MKSYTVTSGPKSWKIKLSKRVKAISHKDASDKFIALYKKHLTDGEYVYTKIGDVINSHLIILNTPDEDIDCNDEDEDEDDYYDEEEDYEDDYYDDEEDDGC